SGSEGTVVSGWAPPPVPTPKDPEYREKLGPYADLLLRGGIVPYGSEEHIGYLASCIESAGFTVTLDPSGQGFAVATGVQMDQYNQVRAACGQVAIDSGLVAALAPATHEFRAAEYQARLVQYQCLIDHGFQPSEPPSEQAFLEEANWDPFSGVANAQFAAAEQACSHSIIPILEQMVASRQATSP
ncbi:MAG: hypothetical protein GXP34_08870, partial [Actinobacteria bacterium]|nr:hypothetical protein [Actinomycetota bacterium]